MASHDARGVDQVRAAGDPGFMTTEVVGKMATRANVKTVVLTHLCCSPRPGNDDYTPRAEEVKKHFPGQVLIAEDLMEF